MEGPSRPREIATRALAGLGASILAFGVFVASAYLHLATRVGRDALGDAITNAASAQTPGELRVEGVREAWLPTVRVDRVRVIGEGGAERMQLRDVTVEIDTLASLYHGGLIIRSAHVGGGTVDLSTAPSGEPWLERALDHDDPEKRVDGGSIWAAPGERLLLIDDVEFEALDVSFASGGTSMDLRGARGRARMWIDDGEDFQGRFSGISGRLDSSAGLIPDTALRDLELTVDPRARSLVHFTSEVRALDTDMTVVGDSPAGRDPVRLCIWTGGPSLATFLGLGAETLVGALSDVDLDVRPSHAPRNPSCARGASS